MTSNTPHGQGKAEHTAAGQAALRSRLVGKARELAPLLRANADEGERERRIPQENLAALDAAGLFALRSPARFGGLEADCRTYMEVVTELGRGCGSTAWIAFISNATAWVACRFPEEVRREIFEAKPDARFIGLLAPTATVEPAESGIVVNGRWGFASGCLHADWALLAVPLRSDDGEFVPGVVIMPMSDLTIEDTWYFAGCRATGSNTVVATDVFVPMRRVLPLPAMLACNAIGPDADPPVFREAFSATAIIMVAAPILGMAEAAFDLTLERANSGNKRISYSVYADQRQAAAMQIKMAEVRSLIDSARASMMGWADRIADAARAGEELAFLDRARLRVDIGTAMQSCRDAVDRLLSVQGASAFADANPMQRVWRDLEFGSRHGLLSPEVPLEILGRALFGDTEMLSPMV